MRKDRAICAVSCGKSPLPCQQKCHNSRTGVPRPVTIVDFEHRSRPHAVPARFFGAPVLRGCGCTGLEIPCRRWVVKMKRASVSGVAEEAEHNGFGGCESVLAR